MNEIYPVRKKSNLNSKKTEMATNPIASFDGQIEISNGIYLDNNATTKVAPEVLMAISHFFTEHYGNASSTHLMGQVASRALFESRNVILKELNANAHKVIFTSGGTESNNLAIFGIARNKKINGSTSSPQVGRHVITTSIEHSSVLDCIKSLSKEGYEISYVDPREDGIIHSEDVTQLMRDDTILVSIMNVNNETGGVNDVEKIASAVKAKRMECTYHSDGVQAIGKIKPNLSKIDLYSISGHKFHGPKGVGALIVREGTPLININYGGGQEGGLRNGTENIPGIVGLTKAMKLCYTDFENNINHYKKIKEELLREISSLKNVFINSPEVSTPQTINISFVGIPGEALLMALSEKGVYIGTGSACTQKKRGRSHVLTAMGLSGERMNSSIRFSFSRYTTSEEIRKVGEVLRNSVAKLVTN